MQLLTQVLALIFVISTMLAVALQLTPRDITAALHDRPWLGRALLANAVLLPALAYAMTRLLPMDASLAAALLILATAPGGPVLIKLVTLARGDHALAVGLLVCLLLAGVLLQPVILPQLLEGIRISSMTIVLTQFTSVLAPLLVGLGLRAAWPRLAARLQGPIQRLSTLCMLLICVSLPLAHWQELQGIAGSGAFLVAALFLLGGSCAGWLLGGPNPAARRVLALSCAQPNMAAAMVISTQNFSDPRVVLMLLVIMLTSLPILIPLCLHFARQQSVVSP